MPGENCSSDVRNKCPRRPRPRRPTRFLRRPTARAFSLLLASSSPADAHSETAADYPERGVAVAERVAGVRVADAARSREAAAVAGVSVDVQRFGKHGVPVDDVLVDPTADAELTAYAMLLLRRAIAARRLVLDLSRLPVDQAESDAEVRHQIRKGDAEPDAGRDFENSGVRRRCRRDRAARDRRKVGQEQIGLERQHAVRRIETEADAP